MSEETQHKEKIVEWLKSSKQSRAFKSGRGFFVSKGPQVRLKDSSVVDLLDWLLGEGLTDGAVIAGYSISHDPKGDYPERLSFFEAEIEDAPFMPSGK